MQISFNSYNSSPYFTSRKKEIRDADDIQRKTRQTFPMMSPTYIDEFYGVTKFRSKNKSYARRISDKKYDTIAKSRDIAQYPDAFGLRVSQFEKNTPYIIDLNLMKATKLGNCMENAKAAVATLCANGYYNSKRAGLYLQVDFVNKKTGELEHSELGSLDHSFAVTDMNEGNGYKYVVDPWLGFADGVEGAISRFKQVYSEKDYHTPISDIRYRFVMKKRRKNEEFYSENYDVKTRMKIVIMEDYSEEKMKDLGDYSRIMYDGIVLDKNKIPKE